MATYERQIDTLGGAGNEDTEYNAGYHDGYSRAIDAATLIGADADALVDELVECIKDVLGGREGLIRWATDAELLVRRVREREARA